MPFSINIGVFSRTDCELPHPCSHLIRDAIASSIQGYDSNLSAALMDESQINPLAISTLWARVRPKGNMLQVPRYTRCRFRFSALDQGIFDELSSPFFMRLAANGKFKLGEHEFFVTETNVVNEDNDLASYRELYEDIGDRVSIRFISPAVFEEDGLNILLPDTKLVYSTLWKKWQTFSDFPIPQSVFMDLMNGLSLAKVRIHSKSWSFPDQDRMGFIGSATYKLSASVPAESKMLFGALSRLAFFGGVGLSTILGMGQCRVFIES